MRLEDLKPGLPLVGLEPSIVASIAAEVVPVFRARSGLRMNELVVLELNRCLVTDA